MVTYAERESPPARGDTEPGAAHPNKRAILRWLYLGRLTLLAGILAAAVVVAERPERVAAITMAASALLVTAVSFWYTHVLEREPGENFLYAQVIFDVALVTGIVHITQGPNSPFAPAYILVISAGALLLPLAGGVLMGALASITYFADLVWGYQETFSLPVAAQIGLFTVVAIITGLLGDRLRRAGTELGEVASELERLRLDTGDILANLMTGVLTVDGDGRLVYHNPAASRLLGLTLERFHGLEVLEVLEATAPGMGELLAASIRERRSFERFRTTATHPSGRRVRLGVSTAVLARAEDDPPSVTAIFQDITDLERVEELNLRTERLEAVAALSASLAHEIKNPLASIRSSVEQLGNPGLTPADRATLERLVLRESDRLSRLLSEFLEFSVMKPGSPEEVDVGALLTEAAAVAEQHPAFEGVRLEVDLPAEAARVRGDPDLLHRAVLNLLLNAAQATGEGGRVKLRCTTEIPAGRLPVTDVDHPVCITVTDDGPGIPEELQARIFDPFFTTRPSGSGLGLAVVHRAVEAHHGVTLVDRAAEGGARFAIVLPGLPSGAMAVPGAGTNTSRNDDG